MPVCYFNQDYENKYRCEYSITDDDFNVEVEYDIHDEIPYIDGVKCFTINMPWLAPVIKPTFPLSETSNIIIKIGRAHV